MDTKYTPEEEKKMLHELIDRLYEEEVLRVDIEEQLFYEEANDKGNLICCHFNISILQVQRGRCEVFPQRTSCEKPYKEPENLEVEQKKTDLSSLM